MQLNPIAFSIGPFAVHWYGVIIGLGVVVGLILAIREGKRFGIDREFFLDLLLYALPSALIGARIYYVAFSWDTYKNNLWDVFKIWEGGIAIYGALIGAVICVLIFVRKRGYSFWRIADICAPSLLAGQLIGRWGNFINQEAYGGPVDVSFLRETLHLPDFIVNQMFIEGVYHHPTFLYESLWNLLGLILILVIRRTRFIRVGEIFMSYLVWYSIGRFYIEGLRTDSLAFHGPNWLANVMNSLWSPMSSVFEQGELSAIYGNVRSSQLLAVLLIISLIVFVVVRRLKGLAGERYNSSGNLQLTSDLIRKG